MELLGFLTSKRPRTVGPKDGRLQPCDPEKSNCVCSQHSSDSRIADPHHIQPFVFGGDPGDAMTRILAVLLQMKNCRIITNQPGYLHAEITAGLGTVDDLEFLLSAPDQLIHVRSASRLGLSDLGVNRARVDDLRVAFDEAD